MTDGRWANASNRPVERPSRVVDRPPVCIVNRGHPPSPTVSPHPLARAVLDTNAVVSALAFGSGPLAAVRDAWQRGRFVPLASRGTATHLLGVLASPSSPWRHGSKRSCSPTTCLGARWSQKGRRRRRATARLPPTCGPCGIRRTRAGGPVWPSSPRGAATGDGPDASEQPRLNLGLGDRRLPARR